MKVSYGEVVIDLQDEDNINVIIGDFGTGKTKMINDLKSILNVYYSGEHVESDTDLDTVVILDPARIRNGEYKDLREKTIFIDKFDRWATDELIEFVRNQYNCFFLIGRDRVCEVGSLMSINLLGYDGTTYRLINMYRNKKEFESLYQF